MILPITILALVLAAHVPLVWMLLRAHRRLRLMQDDAILHADQFDAIERDIGTERMKRLRSAGFDAWQRRCQPEAFEFRQLRALSEVAAIGQEIDE